MPSDKSDKVAYTSSANIFTEIDPFWADAGSVL